MTRNFVSIVESRLTKTALYVLSAESKWKNELAMTRILLSIIITPLLLLLLLLLYKELGLSRKTSG